MLILARLMGYRGPAPTPDNLVPRALARLPLAEFMTRLPAADAEWAERTKHEAARGQVLRYVVAATPRGVSARLVAVPVESPIGALQGTRNLVAFTTRRYEPNRWWSADQAPAQPLPPQASSTTSTRWRRDSRVGRLKPAPPRTYDFFRRLRRSLPWVAAYWAV